MAEKDKRKTLSVLQKQMNRLWRNSSLFKTKNRRNNVKIKNRRKPDR